MSELIKEQEAAKFLAMSRSFLRNARHTGIGGPEFIKIGRSVRYRITDLETWLESRKRINTLKQG